MELPQPQIASTITTVMQKISNDIINLSLEKDTENTPTKGLFYLFKDGKIIEKGNNFKKIKSKYDEIKKANIDIINETTREFREAPTDNNLIYSNWMSSTSSLTFFGGKPKRSEAEKLDLNDKNKPK